MRAIEALIAADPAYNRPDTMRLLQAFAGSKYWKSRKLIVEYISERYRRGCLTGADYDSALGLLEQWATDGRSSDENGKRARAALALLRGYDDLPNSSRQTS